MKEKFKQIFTAPVLDRHEDEYYISFYLPVSQEKKADISSYLKSYLLRSLREHDSLGDEGKIHGKIIEKILEIAVPQVKFESQLGIAIFLRLDASEVAKYPLDEVEVFDVNILSLYRKPEIEVFIGKIYSIGQLLTQANLSSNTLVINLHEEECEVIEVSAQGVKRLDKKSNRIISQEPEYSRVIAPRGDFVTTHGTGGNIEKRDEKKLFKRFLKESLDEITSSHIKGKKYDYLAVLYSASYANFIESTVEAYGFPDGDLTPILVEKNLESLFEIRHVVQDKIFQTQSSKLEDDLKEIKGDPDYYREGWLDVTKAINKGQVSTLLLKTGNHRVGYVNYELGLVYTYPARGTHKVHNLLPWVAKIANDRGGKIWIMKEEWYTERFSDFPEVAALLRFKLEG